MTAAAISQVAALSAVIDRRYSRSRPCVMPVLAAGGRGLRHVVTATGPHFESFVCNIHADFSESAVQPAVARPVTNLILGTQFFTDVDETGRKILNLKRKEGLSAGLGCEFLERLVPPFLFLGAEEAAGIRADRVDGDVVLLRRFQRFSE